MREPRITGGTGRARAPRPAAASVPPAADGAAPPKRASPGETPASAITIHSLTTYAKKVLEGGIPEVWVKGEVTGFRAFRSGHWYFCLKDRMASVDCVIWASDTKRVGRRPEDGMEVAARGRLTIWPASGKTQFAIRRIEETGEGAARRAIEQILERLRADGLLAPERKRRVTRYPRRVAMITSLDGAAMHDVVSVARRRAPQVELVIVPARVQGDEAVDTLLDALDRVSRWRDCDTVILGRGGGGKDDLRAFNDERVARAVAACPMPVISAVGHEIDTTVCDLVADVRAPTPSAAAEAAFPETDEYRAMLLRAEKRLADTAARRVDRSRRRITEALHQLGVRAQRVVDGRRGALERIAARMDALSPLATLSRGYAVAVDPSGGALTSAGAFTPGGRFDLILHDGRVRALAESVSDEPPSSAGRATRIAE